MGSSTTRVAERPLQRANTSCPLVGRNTWTRRAGAGIIGTSRQAPRSGNGRRARPPGSATRGRSHIGRHLPRAQLRLSGKRESGCLPGGVRFRQKTALCITQIARHSLPRGRGRPTTSTGSGSGGSTSIIAPIGSAPSSGLALGFTSTTAATGGGSRTTMERCIGPTGLTGSGSGSRRPCRCKSSVRRLQLRGATRAAWDCPLQ
mmetsp:Transcript_106743/g.300019  ORF Transcript_106743/g.300019 Transcript_106743/m.300019 type:complete len:204 (-) Transcript_106743:5-616(-)